MMIKSHYKGANIIAGVATAGIPHGVLVAEELGLPFIYVRAEAKNHGKKNQIEGHFEEGQSVILVEDLISSGKSSLEVVKVLRSKNLNVKGVVSIFTYGFQNAIDNFDKENCKYTSLSDYNSLLEEAIKSQYIKEDDLSILKEWRINPSNWKR